MSEWYDNQKKPSSDRKKKLAERMAARKRRKLTAKEKKRLEKLEGMLQQLMGGKNVQNRQLKHWLTENEYKEFEENKGEKVNRDYGRARPYPPALQLR